MAEIIKIVLPSSEETTTPTANVTASTDVSSAVTQTQASTTTSTATGGTAGTNGAAAAQNVVGSSKVLVAAAYIKQIAQQYVQHEISLISVKTGAVEYEQRIQFAYSETSQALSSLASVGMGALFGGPVGAAVVSVGVGVSYLTKAFGYLQTSQTLSAEQAVENISLGMASNRVGISGRRSST